ncbi:hypothetical protein [Streptosporangium sandarakinum]|uniref:hypothetical protein n=1 Tax=Streptosporangium sandarakinum TaxID=1260955 RepID=UPI00342851E8
MSSRGLRHPWPRPTHDHHDFGVTVARVGRSPANSHLVITARDESGRPLGLARTVSDDEIVCYVQEPPANARHHGKGVGRRLLERVTLLPDIPGKTVRARWNIHGHLVERPEARAT